VPLGTELSALLLSAIVAALLAALAALELRVRPTDEGGDPAGSPPSRRVHTHVPVRG
jgi:hypothetical protein